MKREIYLALVLLVGLALYFHKSPAPEQEPEAVPVEVVEESAEPTNQPAPDAAVPEVADPIVATEALVPVVELVPEAREFAEVMKETQDEVAINENAPLEDDTATEVP